MIPYRRLNFASRNLMSFAPLKPFSRAIHSTVCLLSCVLAWLAQCLLEKKWARLLWPGLYISALSSRFHFLFFFSSARTLINASVSASAPVSYHHHPTSLQVHVSILTCMSRSKPLSALLPSSFLNCFSY